MKNQKIFKSIALALFLTAFSLTCAAQQTAPLIKRTTYKTETVNFSPGGTVSVVGAPVGSIKVEGWQKAEVEISAEIEIQAETEADLAVLAKINTFALNDSLGHLRVVSVGTHDRDYMKRVAKKFPKNLLNKPFRVDYTIKVPMFTALEIDGGRGDFALTNVEGVMRINFLETNAKLSLNGGAVLATFGNGNVEITIPSRSWRGASVDVQLVQGTMQVQFPVNFNADITAKVLKTGQIENTFAGLKPRDRSKFTEKAMLARAGNGGASLNFTVSDGTLVIK